MFFLGGLGTHQARHPSSRCQYSGCDPSRYLLQRGEVPPDRGEPPNFRLR